MKDGVSMATEGHSSPPKKAAAAKRKRAKLGILGVPRTNRTLFMVNQALDSEEDEGEDLDPSFAPDEDDSSNQSPAPKQRRSTSPTKNKSKSAAAAKPRSKMAGCEGDGWQNGMPHEILLKIFRYFMLEHGGNVLELNRLKSVCQSWNRVALDPKLLFHINFSLHSALKTARGPASLKRISGQLDFFFTQSLSLAGIPLVYENFEALLKKCNPDHLLHLDISSCQKIHKSVKNLSYLKLIGDMFPSLATLKLGAKTKAISTDDLAYLLGKLTNTLRSLDLSHNPLNWTHLNLVADHCPHLEVLDLSYCEIKASKGTAKIDFDYLGEKCAQLRQLNLIRTKPKTKFTSAEAAMLGEPSFKNLELLNMAFGTGQVVQHGTDELIWLMVRLCRDSESLRVLDMRTYKSPLDSQVNIFSFVKSRDLRQLYLCHSNLSEADNYYLANEIETRWLGSLTEIDFSSSNIKDETLGKILDSFVRRSSACSLQKVNLSGTVIEQQTLKRTLPKLTSIIQLNLTSCRSVDRRFKRILDASDISLLVSAQD